MADIFAALVTGVLVLAPVVILATIVTIVSVRRGEQTGHH